MSISSIMFFRTSQKDLEAARRSGRSDALSDISVVDIILNDFTGLGGDEKPDDNVSSLSLV